MKAYLGSLASVCLLAASCSAGSDAAPAPSSLALLEETTTTTAEPPETTMTPRTVTDSWATEFEPTAFYGEWYGPPDTTAPPTTTAPTTVSSGSGGGSSSGSSGGGAPAVTQPGGSPQQPSSLYRGVLGTYGLDQVLANSPVAKPTTQAGTLPLRGTAGSSPNRPAIVVKIDNSSRARPQTGLNRADIVIEEEVEFGITRLAAVFHSNESTVGPVRSGRSTDISFLSGFGTPALVYSGANSVIDQLLLNQTQVSNFSAARSSGYWRNQNRPAPSNLYAKTSSFSSVAPGGAPPAQFHYRPAGVGSSQGVADSSFGVNYPANKVRWEWNGVGWVRSQSGGLHTTDGEPVNAANVVVVAVRSTGTGLFDSTGAPVPEYIFVGSGPAAVFTDGRRVDGTWTRPTLRHPAILHVGDEAITLTPGRTWIQVTSAGQYSQD